MLPFKELRSAMKYADLKQSDLAKHLGVSLAHVNQLFNGHVSWRLNEAYATLELLHADVDEFTDYFPKEL